MRSFLCSCGAGPAKLLTSSSNRSRSVNTKVRNRHGGVKLPNNAGKNPKDHFKMDNKPVGVGAFGTVRLAENKNSGQKSAIKTIEWRAIKDQKAFRNEIEINVLMDHPNIARLFETFEDSRHVYLAMELCRGGELFDFIIDSSYFNEKHAGIFMEQILRAVHYMHSNCVAHRDLKPENFLLMKPAKEVSIENNTLKIIDFGIAKIFEKPPPGCDGKMTMKTKAGTAYYIAPEILMGGYNEKCDIWSCGVIMYILLSGSPPFAGDDDNQIMLAAKKGKLDFSLDEFRRVSPQAKDLICKMCKLKVADRLNSAQALNDPWTQNTKKLTREDSLTNEGSTNLVKNLQKFTHVNRFQKEALNVMAHRLEDEQIKKLRESFLKLDADGNGMLTLNELKAGCAKAGVTSDKELRNLFEELDNDKSGSISYTEFLAAMVEQKHTVNKPLCWEAFRVFDINGDGKIKVDEFLEIMRTSEDVKMVNEVLHASEEAELRRIFADADTNKNGEVDFDEFYRMLNK
mmetsp:Transcript_80209/g.146602  ORF Transcript_80209/g.146602 Transcript_80209/m.146602 type:complete len:514 (-) Transcript_80209:103-1644(-)